MHDLDGLTEGHRLTATRSLGLLDTGPEAEFEELAQLAAAICCVSASLVTLIDERRQFHKAKVGIIDLNEIPRSMSFCEYIIQQDGVFMVEDAFLDDRFSQNPLVLGKPEIRFYAGAPLTLESGHKVGALCVLDVAARRINEQQVLALATLARQVVARTELRQKRVLLDAATQKLRASEALFRAFADNVPFETYLKDEKGALVFYNKCLAERFKITTTEWLGKRNLELWPLELAESLDAEEHRVRKAMERIESAASTPNQDGTETHWRLHQVPYKTADGQVWLAGVAVDITNHIDREAALLKAQQELQEANTLLRSHALTDDLTGLWNRRAFDARLAEEVAAAQRTGQELGLIMIDIDDFKLLNDSFRHPSGDGILRQVGSLLHTHIRLEDVAARYGGEEFALIIPRADQTALEALADRILANIAETEWAQRDVTLSLGIANLCGSHDTPSLLVQAADEALYSAKSDGKACWRRHRPRAFDAVHGLVRVKTES